MLVEIGVVGLGHLEKLVASLVHESLVPGRLLLSICAVFAIVVVVGRLRVFRYFVEVPRWI